jgi:methylmalonyl-CoA mutase N-terminal domain/subunit
VERLTAELEERARELIEEIDRRGGAVECIEYMREAIGDAAFRHHEQVLAGERQVVGVNVHVEEDEQPVEIHRVDPRIEADQVQRLRALRAARDHGAVEARLEDVRGAARDGANLLPPMREALRARATVGEVCGALRAEFGEYDRVRAYRG